MVDVAQLALRVPIRSRSHLRLAAKDDAGPVFCDRGLGIWALRARAAVHEAAPGAFRELMRRVVEKPVNSPEGHLTVGAGARRGLLLLLGPGEPPAARRPGGSSEPFLARGRGRRRPLPGRDRRPRGAGSGVAARAAGVRAASRRPLRFWQLIVRRFRGRFSRRRGVFRGSGGRLLAEIVCVPAFLRRAPDNSRQLVES